MDNDVDAHGGSLSPIIPKQAVITRLTTMRRRKEEKEEVTRIEKMSSTTTTTTTRTVTSSSARNLRRPPVSGSEGNLFRRSNEEVLPLKRRRRRRSGGADPDGDPDWRLRVTPAQVVRTRTCDEVPDEFRRAGIGLCFGGGWVGGWVCGRRGWLGSWEVWLVGWLVGWLGAGRYTLGLIKWTNHLGREVWLVGCRSVHSGITKVDHQPP